MATKDDLVKLTAELVDVAKNVQQSANDTAADSPLIDRRWDVIAEVIAILRLSIEPLSPRGLNAKRK